MMIVKTSVPRRILVGSAVLRKTKRELFIGFLRENQLFQHKPAVLFWVLLFGLFQVEIRSGCSIYVGQLYVPRRILVGQAVLRKTERE